MELVGGAKRQCLLCIVRVECTVCITDRCINRGRKRERIAGAWWLISFVPTMNDTIYLNGIGISWELRERHLLMTSLLHPSTRNKIFMRHQRWQSNRNQEIGWFLVARISRPSLTVHVPCTVKDSSWYWFACIIVFNSAF